MQARYYDPVIGRFYSNDPVDAGSYLSQDNTHGFNRYAYANNNPFKYIDPTGMFACEADSDCETITETQEESGGATHIGETEDGTPIFEVKANFKTIVNDMAGGSEMIRNMRDAQDDGIAVAGTLVGIATGANVASTVALRAMALSAVEKQAAVLAVEVTLSVMNNTGNRAEAADFIIKSARSIKPRMVVYP